MPLVTLVVIAVVVVLVRVVDNDNDDNDDDDTDDDDDDDDDADDDVDIMKPCCSAVREHFLSSEQSIGQFRDCLESDLPNMRCSFLVTFCHNLILTVTI